MYGATLKERGERRERGGSDTSYVEEIGGQSLDRNSFLSLVLSVHFEFLKAPDRAKLCLVNGLGPFCVLYCPGQQLFAKARKWKRAG